MTIVDDFAHRRAGQSRDSFVAHLGGPGVLVRLDERGGKDEPAPWAFHGVPRTLTLPPREDEAVGAQKMREVLEEATPEATQRPGGGGPVPIGAEVGPDDETLTAAPTPPSSMPLPPARGAASVILLPELDGGAELGRTEATPVRVDERSVSKRHARFTLGPQGEVRVEDLGSANGTRINGRVVARNKTGTLRSGDVLELGDVRCLFLDGATFYDRLPDLAD